MSLLTNLVAYYKLDSGALTTDSHGSNTLTNNNTVTGGTAFLGSGSASYSGASGQRLISGNALNLTSSSNNSMSCWVKFTANGYVLDWVTTSGANRCITVYTDYTANKIKLYTWGNDLDPSYTVTPNSWNHVVVTRTSGGTCELFINGASRGTVALGTGGQGSGNALSIGCQWGSSSSITGSVDEVGVWDKVLTGAEITELYNAGVGIAYPFATDVIVSQGTPPAITATIPSYTITAVRTVTVSQGTPPNATFTIPAYTQISTVSVSPSVQTATFSIPAYDVLIADIIASPSVVTATFTIPAYTPTAVANTTVTPSMQVCTFTIPAYTPTVVSNITISPSPFSMVFSIPTYSVLGDYWEDKFAQPSTSWSNKF